jgi:recombination protein RecR
MKPIEKLIEAFKKFPSVGPKQAERFTMYIMRADISEIKSLIDAITDLKNTIKLCSKCNNYTDSEICDICLDEKRDKNFLCVVDTTFDIVSIEKTKMYNGLYFVLGSYIIPHLNNNEFFSRFEMLKNRLKNEKIKELIIALNTTTEGQTTSLYLKNNLSGYVEKITRIAFGVPLGADIDYMDEYTLGWALKGRSEM